MAKKNGFTLDDSSLGPTYKVPKIKKTTPKKSTPKKSTPKPKKK